MRLTLHTGGGGEDPPLSPQSDDLRTVLPADGRGGTDGLEAGRGPAVSLCLELSNSRHLVIYLSHGTRSVPRSHGPNENRNSRRGQDLSTGPMNNIVVCEVILKGIEYKVFPVIISQPLLF